MDGYNLQIMIYNEACKDDIVKHYASYVQSVCSKTVCVF